ncbi:hypothetical protein ONZ45_g9475 [Pleurotus djamor]|nr:hypothetical protein ONZ45_g9475 [Pleurotus djamor]
MFITVESTNSQDWIDKKLGLGALADADDDDDVVYGTKRCPVTTMFKTIRRCFAEPASTQSIELVEHGFDALPPDADHEDTRWHEPIDRSEATILSPMFYLAGILFLLVTSIAMTQALLTHAPVPEVFRELLYTPAESLLEYEQIRFHTGFLDEEQLSAFDGPSTVIMDQAWSDLYDTQKYAIVALIEEENNRLADPTIPFLGNRSQLYGGLDVFHQLHCLPPSVFGLIVLDSMRSSDDVNYLQVNDVSSQRIRIKGASISPTFDLKAFNTLLATLTSPSELTLITMKLAVSLVSLSTLAAIVSSTTCEDSGAVDRILPFAYPVGV